MNRIYVLSDSVANKIAAGEVIGGPFSVVKELMENSLDAGATRIEVMVEDSGMKRIVVRDNGHGIRKDDMPLAVREHATSKIREVEDIEGIGTFGFRGEALSSMAAVAELTILSRSPDEPIGAKLVSKKGHAEVKEYAGPLGTSVIVENLFYNIPARKKFLKTKGTEMRYLREVFLRTALPHAGIEFLLDIDGTRAVTLQAVGSVEQRIGGVYSIEAGECLAKGSIQDLKVTITGFVSRPHFFKPTRSMQLLFVNKRLVEYKYLSSLLSRSYGAEAPKGKYPAAFLFVTIDPRLIDVNIHPAKRELKFFDQRYIDDLIVALVKKSLSGPQKITGELFQKQDESTRREGTTAVEERARVEQNMFGGSRVTVRADSTITPSGTVQSIVKEMRDLYAPHTQEARFTILGVAFATYCIVEIENSLHFIDLHAAHERIIYDSLVKKNETHEVQELLFPKVMQLSVEDHGIVLDHLEALAKVGYQIEDFSDNAIVIRAIPEIARSASPEDIVTDFIESVKEERADSANALNLIAASVACHSAKRAGDTFPYSELVDLVDKALEEGRELRCPHGRPYLYKIEKNDLERIFKRQ